MRAAEIQVELQALEARGRELTRGIANALATRNDPTLSKLTNESKKVLVRQTCLQAALRAAQAREATRR